MHDWVTDLFPSYFPPARFNDQEISPFELAYLENRSKEGRMYSLESLMRLPFVESTSPLHAEWAIRRQSAEKLAKELSTKRRTGVLLEIGCGNGWLSHFLAQHTGMKVLGTDINVTELRQAEQAFYLPNLDFSYLDVFKNPEFNGHFEVILLAASVQYFPEFHGLIRLLLDWLSPGGEIHIMDSPFYEGQKAAEEARRRTHSYYEKMGYPELGAHYFHHQWEEVKAFDFKLLYSPYGLKGKLLRRINRTSSPFPWVVIRK